MMETIARDELEATVPEYTRMLRWVKRLLDKAQPIRACLPQKCEPVYCCECAHVLIGEEHEYEKRPQFWRCAARDYNPLPFISHDGERVPGFCSVSNDDGKCKLYGPRVPDMDFAGAGTMPTVDTSATGPEEQYPDPAAQGRMPLEVA